MMYNIRPLSYLQPELKRCNRVHRLLMPDMSSGTETISSGKRSMNISDTMYYSIIRVSEKYLEINIKRCFSPKKKVFYFDSLNVHIGNTFEN